MSVPFMGLPVRGGFKNNANEAELEFKQGELNTAMSELKRAKEEIESLRSSAVDLKDHNAQAEAAYEREQEANARNARENRTKAVEKMLTEEFGHSKELRKYHEEIRQIDKELEELSQQKVNRGGIPPRHFANCIQRELMSKSRFGKSNAICSDRKQLVWTSSVKN